MEEPCIPGIYKDSTPATGKLLNAALNSICTLYLLHTTACVYFNAVMFLLVEVYWCFEGCMS